MPNGNDEDFEKNEPMRDLTIRVPPGRVVGLRRTHLRVAAILGTAVIGVALVVGLGIDFRGSGDRASRELDPPRNDQRPLKLSDLPGSYDQWAALKASTTDQSSRSLDRPLSDASAINPTPSAADAAQARLNDELRQRLDRLADAALQAAQENGRLRDELARRDGEADKDRERVRASPLFFKIDEQGITKAGSDSAGTAGVSSIPAGTLADAASLSAAIAPPTDQQRKLAFLNQRSADSASLLAINASSRSDRTLQPGTIIPAALLTGINTDLPGQVTAVVTRPVYDSAAGRNVLIPQGARLVGTYDSEVANGQNRALLAWDRLLLPDGRSVDLQRMPGTDAAGYAGVADLVDYHADQLAAGVGLSGVLAYVGNLARGHSGNDADARDVIGDTVAQEASRIGSKLVDRQLNIQPTITVRPGQAVYVMVDKAIELEPFRE